MWPTHGPGFQPESFLAGGLAGIVLTILVFIYFNNRRPRGRRR